MLSDILFWELMGSFFATNYNIFDFIMIRRFGQKALRCSYKGCYLMSSLNRQKAIVAMDYVMEIAKSTNLEDGEPLMKRIQNIKPTVDEITPEVSQEIKKIFNEGANLDTQIFTQSRILSPIKSGIKGLFPFYPTALVTQPIFQMLQDNTNIRTMTSGPFGIAKTSSYVLFWYLSNIINEYLYQAPTEDRKKFIGQFPIVPSKLLYWNVDINMSDYAIKEKIIKQCHNRLQDHLTQQTVFNLPLGEFCQKVSALYNKKGIKCSIVFDQINALVSVMRSAKALKEEKKSEEYQELLKSQSKRERKERKEKEEMARDQFIQARRTRKRIHAMRNLSCFGGTIYLNSSINIERELLKKDGSEYSLQLHGHDVVEENKIEYFKNIQTKVGQEQLTEIVKKELFLHMPEIMQSANITKSDFDSKLNSQQNTLRWSNFVRPLTIFQTLQNPQNSSKINDLKNEKTDLVRSIVSLINSQSKQIVKEPMEKFFLKNKTQNLQDRKTKFRLCSHLHLLLKIRMDKGLIQEHQAATFTEEELQQTGFFKKALIQQNQQDLRRILDKTLSKELLTMEGRKIHLHLSVADFFEFWGQKLRQKGKEIQPILPDYQVQGQSQKGCKIQRLFTEYMIKNLRNRKINLAINSKIYHIADKPSRFRHFHRQTKKPQPNGFYNLKYVIDSCVQFPQNYVFGYPVLNSYFEQKLDLKNEAKKATQYSTAIDFLFARYHKDTQILEIDSFDFATSKTTKNITEKLQNNNIEKIRNYLSEYLKKEERSEKRIQGFILNHSIVVIPSMKEKLSNPYSPYGVGLVGFDTIYNLSHISRDGWDKFTEMQEQL